MADPNAKILRPLLRPIARLCIRRSLRIQELLDQAREVFIEVATEELQAQGSKANASRIHIVTGINREMIARILGEGEGPSLKEPLASKVITQWRTDKDFLTPAGKPRVLSLKGIDSDFKELVRRVSIDLKPGTVLFDLERVGAVERSKQGVRLISTSYSARNDADEGFRTIARDVGDLVEAGLENIETSDDPLNYHTSVIFDNIDASDLSKVKKWIFRESNKYHEKVVKFLSKLDVDLNPVPKKTGGKRVAVTIFSRFSDH